MKKNLVSILLLFAIAFTACAHTKKLKQKKQNVASAPHQISQVTMMRSPCFGRCPNYVVTVMSNGMVKYEGQAFTRYKGTYQKDQGIQAATELFKEFMSYRADTCQPEYRVKVPDVPGIYYKLVVDGKEQKINNANFGPGFLRELSASVDNLAQIDDTWQKQSDTTNVKW